MIKTFKVNYMIPANVAQALDDELITELPADRDKMLYLWDAAPNACIPMGPVVDLINGG